MTDSDVSEPRKVLKKMQNVFRICIRGCGGRDAPHMLPISELFLTPTDLRALSELRISLNPKSRSQFCGFECLELTSTAIKLDCRLEELNPTPL